MFLLASFICMLGAGELGLARDLVGVGGILMGLILVTSSYQHGTVSNLLRRKARTSKQIWLGVEERVKVRGRWRVRRDRERWANFIRI